MKKLVSLLLLLSMIIYSSAISSLAEEYDDNRESVIESNVSDQIDIKSNEMGANTVSIIDENSNANNMRDSATVEDRKNIVNYMTQEELETYHLTLDQNEFSKVKNEERIALSAEDSNYVSGWVSCGTMTSARSYMASAVVDNQIYTFGGQENGIAVRTSEKFLTSKEIWYKCTPMPKARYKHSALAIGDKIYICAGYDADGQAASDIYVYNTSSDSWEDVIATPNNNTNYAAVVYDGELYIISGLENNETSKKIYKYNIEAENWSYVANIQDEFIDAKAAVQENDIVVFYGAYMYFYKAEKNFQSEDTMKMKRELVDYALISRDFKGSIYKAYLPDDTTTMGFYVTGGRPENSDVSTATTSAYYYGGNFFVAAGWSYDLRLIRGLACHNMVEANGYIYVFGGQVVKGTDQKVMFKRSVKDLIDDVPVTTELKNGAVVGSINGYGDIDSFTITPQRTSLYSFRPYTYWHGLEFSLKYGNKQLGVFYDQGGVDKYSYGFDRTLEEGKTYTIDVSVPLSYDDQCGEYAFAYVPINDDVPNYFDEAQAIKINTNYSRNFEGIDDMDCFKFNVTDLGNYNLSTTSSSQNLIEYSIYSESNTENALYEFSLASMDTTENKIQLAPGNYYIKFQGSDGSYKFSLNHTGNIYHLFEDRCKHQMTAMKNKLYAVGGLDNSFNNISDIEVYAQSQKEWSVEKSGLDINSGSSAISFDDSIYLVGGRTQSSGEFSTKIQKYNPSTQTFSSVGQLKIARERPGLAILDNNMYVAGGRNEYGYLKTIEIYNTNTNSVSKTLELPSRIIDPQIYFFNDILYVIAGADEMGFSNKVYALEENTWVEKSSMPYTSDYVRGDEYNGNFYCATVNSKDNVDILKYDTANDAWTILKEDFIKSRIYYDTAILNGFLYITGGYSITNDAVTDDVYSIDIVTDITSMDQAIPIRTIGFEFEQKINDSVINSPEILGVNAKTIDAEKGIYELYLNEDDYISDVRSIPFFFWSAREGMFSALSEDYRRVMFYADPNTGDRKIKIVVGIGDDRGYVDKKAFNLTGNSTEE